MEAAVDGRRPASRGEGNDGPRPRRLYRARTQPFIQRRHRRSRTLPAARLSPASPGGGDQQGTHHARARGAGHPQGTFAMERIVDRIAAALDLRARRGTPAEFRPGGRRCPMRARSRPAAALGSCSTAASYPACLEAALEAADMADFRARQAAARAVGRHLGIGLANYVKGTGRGPFEAVTVRVAPSGRVSPHHWRHGDRATGHAHDAGADLRRQHRRRAGIDRGRHGRYRRDSHGHRRFRQPPGGQLPDRPRWWPARGGRGQAAVARRRHGWKPAPDDIELVPTAARGFAASPDLSVGFPELANFGVRHARLRSARRRGARGWRQPRRCPSTR